MPMPRAKPGQSKFDASVLSQLACPACYGDLRLEGSHLICTACGRAYPIVDGIPVLIVARAEKAETSAVAFANSFMARLLLERKYQPPANQQRNASHDAEAAIDETPCQAECPRIGPAISASGMTPAQAMRPNVTTHLLRTGSTNGPMNATAMTR